MPCHLHMSINSRPLSSSWLWRRRVTRRGPRLCAISSPRGVFNDVLWEGTEAEALGSRPCEDLPPPWRVMLLSDGSVTRHLQLLTKREVHVDCIEMAEVGEAAEGLPEDARLVSSPRLQRKVLLRSGDAESRALVFATSWWNAQEAGVYMKDREQPIWVNLTKGRLELYRDIRRIYYGHSPFLEEQLGSQGPFWARHYIFWHDGKPLTVIFEAFSNHLRDFLGDRP